MTCPIEPHAGDRVSANLIREIIRYLRAITPLQGRGVRLTYGPNGTRIEADAGTSSRQGGGSTKGCFYIKKVSGGDGGGSDPGAQRSYTVEFGNPYYRVAGQLFTLDKDHRTVEYSERAVVCLYFSSVDGAGATVRAFEDFNEAAETANEDPVMQFIPLYEMDGDGKVAVDYRDMPVAVQGEIGNIQTTGTTP